MVVVVMIEGELRGGIDLTVLKDIECAHGQQTLPGKARAPIPKTMEEAILSRLLGGSVLRIP